MIDQITKFRLDERVRESFYNSKLVNNGVEGFTYWIGLDRKPIKCWIYERDIKRFENFFHKTLTKYLPENCHCFVAGGSVLTYILYENALLINDYDIFVPNNEEFEKIDIFLTKLSLKEHGGIFENENTKHFSFKGLEIDLIKRFSPSINILLLSFDINLCKVGFEIKNNKCSFSKKTTFEEIFKRVFIIDYSNTDFKKDGIKILKRILKYTSKGFKIDRSCLIKFYISSLTTFLEPTKNEYNDIIDSLSEQINNNNEYAFSIANSSDDGKKFVRVS